MIRESNPKKGATTVDRISRMSKRNLINRWVGGAINIFTTQKWLQRLLLGVRLYFIFFLNTTTPLKTKAEPYLTLPISIKIKVFGALYFLSPF